MPKRKIRSSATPRVTNGAPNNPSYEAGTGRYLRAVAVVSKVVLAVAGVRDGTLRRQALDTSHDRGWRGEVLKPDQVGGETCNMGSSHAGSRDGVHGGGVANPGGENVNTGGEDIKNRSKVREVRAGVGLVNGADSDGVWCRGRGVVSCVCTVVTGSDDDGNTRFDGRGDGGVDGIRVLATKRHGEDGLRASVLANPLDTSNDTRVGAGSFPVEDLDSDELGLVGYAVSGSANSTSAVGAVSVLVSILRALDEVSAPSGAATKLLW